MKRMRRKRIRNTIFLLLLLIVLCTAGGFGVYMLKGGDFPLLQILSMHSPNLIIL